MLEATKKNMNVRKRDGRVLSFDRQLILNAIQKAFCAQLALKQTSDLEADLIDKIQAMTDAIVDQVHDLSLNHSGVAVEHIQDVVERELMRSEFYEVARRYILYRAEHTKMRQLRAEETMDNAEPFPSMMVERDGKLENLDFDRLWGQVETACGGLNDECSSEELINEVRKQCRTIADGAPQHGRALVLRVTQCP